MLGNNVKESIKDNVFNSVVSKVESSMSDRVFSDIVWDCTGTIVWRALDNASRNVRWRLWVSMGEGNFND